MLNVSDIFRMKRDTRLKMVIRLLLKKRKRVKLLLLVIGKFNLVLHTLLVGLVGFESQIC